MLWYTSKALVIINSAETTPWISVQNYICNLKYLSE